MIGFAEDITLGEVLDLFDIANEAILNLSEQPTSLHKLIPWHEDRLKQLAREDESARLLRRIPSAVTASAIIATVGDGHQFRSGRECAAWLDQSPYNSSKVM